MRFKTSNIDVEVSVTKIGSSLLIRPPKIRLRTVDGDLVRKVRVVTDRKFMWQGKELDAEIKLTDPESGKDILISEALEYLIHFNTKHLTEDGAEVDPKPEKEQVMYFAIDEEGKESEVSPFEHTTLLEIPEENWILATDIEERFIYDGFYESSAPHLL